MIAARDSTGSSCRPGTEPHHSSKSGARGSGAEQFVASALIEAVKSAWSDAVHTAKGHHQRRHIMDLTEPSQSAPNTGTGASRRSRRSPLAAGNGA